VRSLAAFAAVGLAALFVATPAHSEILYVRPDGDSSSRVYRWGNEVVPDPLPIKDPRRKRRGISEESQLAVLM
jgi:hypothetical protein